MQRWLQMALVVAVVQCMVPPAGAADLKVVVTIKPVHALTAAVMAGVAEPRLLVDGTASPHTYSLKPSDVKLANDAQILIRISESLEPFTGKLVKALPKSVRVVTLEQTRDLTLLQLREGGAFEAHAHEKDAGRKDGHDHAHAHKAAAKGAKSGIDGHIWLDPENAKKIAGYIADQLAAVSPQHAATFKANAERLGERVDQLNRELIGILKPVAGKSYIVFHDAYQYFEARYGLAPAGSVTVNPDVPASAKRLTELRRKIVSLKAACVFAEPQFTPKVIDTIVEGTSARRGTLDPLGAAIPAGPDQYFAMMKALASDLRSCLNNPS